MDFVLSLTHFCEIHGPKSVLCTQVLPLECALCRPRSPSLYPKASCESLATHVRDPLESTRSSYPPSLRQTDTNLTWSTNFSGASTNVDSHPPSPSVERHPLPKGDVDKRDFDPQFRYGRAQGDTCTSCSFSVPQSVAAELPAGAPGSVKSDGKTKNGAPVLRSREFVCMRKQQQTKSHSHLPALAEHGGRSQDSHASSSLQSSASGRSECHDHILTYLTARSPDDPEKYSLLRAAVIRTLSCEQLPRGTSDGPFCFGDSNTGYTIAYVFRLPDPKARGRRRAYALVALAGEDADRAFRACPIVWEAFSALAQAIERAAQSHQNAQKQKEEVDKSGGQNYTPISSFLTQRTNDPDGHPRRTGQFTPQSLADIVGDESIFTILHQYFVAILKHLGDRFGGLPLTQKPSVYHTVAHDQGIDHQNVTPHVQTEILDELIKTRHDDDKTPTPASNPTDEMEVVKSKLSKNLQLNSQCAPLATNVTAQREVVV